MKKSTYLLTLLLTALFCLPWTSYAWGDEITVADGTTTNQYVPFYGYYADQTGMRSQIIYLAADLEEMVGGTISKLTFYSSTSSWTNTATFTLSLAEVDATSLSAIDGTTVLTLVKSGYTLSSNASGKLEITFTDPFVYSEGKNLLVDLTMTNKGSEKSKYYYGVTASGASYLKYGSSGYTTSPNFRPKATFTYEPGAVGGCAKPKALTKGAVTATSATFTWTAGGSETSWQWICLPAATAVDWSSQAVKTATSATATATGLNAETNYKFYVRANCGSEQSAEVSKAFTTPCAGASLPFEQNFDGEATNTIPSCWAKFAYVSGDYSYPFVYSGGVTGNCMYFYGGGATSAQTIILPPMAEPTNTLLLSFSYKNYSTSTSNGQAKIGYVTDPEDASTFVALAGGSLTRTTSWTEVKKFALSSAPANSYIAIQLSGGASGYNSQRLYIDDIKVALPSSCTDPSEVSAVAASATSATVSWTENGSATAWNIQYSTDNFATHTDVNNVTTNPYTITGLSGNTTYKVRVQSNCGSEQSDWVVSEAFETPCEPTTGIGWTADFAGASTGSAAGLPSCWVKNSTNSYPYIYQYGARSNSRCMQFGGTSTAQPIAVLPPFSEVTNTLYVTLWYNNAYEYGDYSASSYGQLAIGYMTNPADASTFVAQEVFARVNTYTQAKVALTNAPAGSRVAIRYVNGGSSTGYLFVDDITITAIPSCVDPSGVIGSATSTEEASISWTENGTATAWQVRYSSDNGETWSDAVNASTNPFILTGLSAKTTYIAQVKAKCGEEEFSEWSASSEPFSTPCPPQAASYSFGFETEEGALNGAFPTSECWKRISSSSYPAVYNYSAKTGSQSLRFYGSGTQYAILPQFNEDVKGLTLSFYYFNYSWGGALSVGYMTDPEDAGTFVLLQDLANITAYAAAATEINLSTADAGARYIAFKYVGSESYHYSILDDVVVEKALSCQKPTDVLVSDVTATTAVVDWTENNSAEAWKLQISTNNVDWTDVNGGANITDKPYTLTGLTANHTTYYVRVKSVCGGSDASNWSAASDPFETECAAATLPFNENFDGTIGCWTKELCYSTTGLYNGTFRFYYNNTWASEVPPQYLISPEIDAAGKQVTVEFDYYMYDGTETFKVGYSTTTNDVSAFIWGAEQTATNTSALRYSENLPVGVKYVAIMHTSNDQYYLYIDNFSVAEYVAPACPAVSAATLEESNVTAHTATVTWEAGDEETAWNLQYKAAGAAEWSDVIAISTTPSYDMSGLAENTIYYVRVQANCGEDLSEWTGDEAFSFPTDCEPKAVSKASPWSYDFEDTNDGFMPSCWERTEPYANYGNPVVAEYSYYAQSGDKYLYLRTPGRSGGSAYTEDAILPVFNTEIKNLKVSFVYFNGATTSNYGQLAIGYVVGNEFTQVGDLLAQVEDYTLVEREMPDNAPDGARIAIRCIGSTKNSTYTTTAYVDDIQVSLKPSCYTPTALAAAETSDGAVLTWTAGKDENEWSVRYSVKDADEWTVVDDEITATNYTLTGLSQNVTYEVQVKAVCGVGDESAWSASAEFEPVCNAPSALAVTARTQNTATFSWTSSESAWVLEYSTDGENWESENVTVNPFTLEGLTAGQAYQAKIQSACGSDFSNVVEFTTWCDSKLSLPVELTSFSAIPACWEESPAGAIQIAESKLCFVGEGERFLYLPQTDVNLNLLSATFTFSGSLEFGYIDAPNGAFQAFETQPTSGVELNLENEAAAAKYIAIRYNGASNLSQAAISAISIRKTPNCVKPDAPAVTPGTNSASISWTAGSETWNLQYKTGSADWTTVAVSENPYTLSGLAQGTTYKVRVQADCGSGDLSDWSDEAEFTTSCSGIAELPYIADFSHALSNCWIIFAEDETNYKPYANTTMNQLVMDGGKDGASNNVVVMPPFAADLVNAVIGLEYSCSTGANYAQLEVGYVTDKADAATFMALETLAQSSSWVEARVATATVPENAYIAFRYAGASSHGDLAIRNLRILEHLTLADTDNNSAILYEHLGKAVDVTIGRTIVCADYYNTICLPFSLPTLDGTPLEGGDLWAFKYAKVDEATGELLFRIVEASSIEAGIPYFIAFPSGDPIANPLFKNVTISATSGKSVGNDIAKLWGIVDQPEVFVPNDETKLFLAAHNTLYWWEGDSNSQLNNFRAFFIVNTGGASHAPIFHGMPARIIKEEETATGINDVQTNTIQSIKLLENDQVVIIRNGVKYNIQGQVIEKLQ